ncbi:MAG: M20/M25/M40 family metallo-hydrolase [Candidatus Thorarchaeota archaeon]|nr:MAG: M20/M25/M40 family metallo-hydrolase [Candidatus Thorarchaeota archaeon]
MTSASTVYATDLAEEIYNLVCEDSFKQFIIKVSENGTREYETAENVYAKFWIMSQLENVSDGAIEVTEFGEHDSVLGRLPGTLGSDGPVVMVGGHYDTVDAPGANDDGTGIAAALELARILSNYTWPLDIYFCFWNAEEIGLHGSWETAEMFAEEERDILVYFNIDMLLVQDPSAPTDERIWMVYDNHPGALFQDSQYWAELTRVMNNNFDQPIILPLPGTEFQFYGQSDHYPFHATGYRSSLFAFESGISIDSAFHSHNDTWDNPLYNYTIATSTVSSIGASIAYTLSRTMGQQTVSKYNFNLIPGSTKELYIEISIDTELTVEGSWSGADGLEFALRRPSGVALTYNSTSLSEGVNETVLTGNTSNLGLHVLEIENTGSGNVGIEVTLSHDTDIEGNGVPDCSEPWYNDFNVDSDLDGISDGHEELMGDDRYGDNPDIDGDGLSNLDEINVYGTDHLSSDTDTDGMPDGWEVVNGLDPLSAGDRFADPDEDGLSNLDEFWVGTDPHNNDSDSDTMPDGWEIENDLDPTVDDSFLDSDGDGLLNSLEYAYGLNPMVADWIDPIIPISLGGASVVFIVLVVIYVRRKGTA